MIDLSLIGIHYGNYSNKDLDSNEIYVTHKVGDVNKLIHDLNAVVRKFDFIKKKINDGSIVENNDSINDSIFEVFDHTNRHFKTIAKALERGGF